MAPKDDVLQGHLLALGALQTAILMRSSAGPRLPELEQLGPFAALYVDDGGWTADGPARARLLIAAAIDTYVRRDPNQKQVTAIGFDRTIRAAALRAYWGVDRHPLSAKEIIPLLVAKHAVQPELSIGNIANWAKEFALDPEVQAAAWERLPRRAVPRTLPVWPRDTWDGVQANWPPSRNWPPNSRQPRNERMMILDAGRQVLRAEARRRDSKPGDGGFDVSGIDLISDDELLSLIRELVAKELIERHFADETSSQLLRHANIRVIGPWNEMQVRETEGRPGKLPRVVAVATQMFVHSAVSAQWGGRLISAADRMLDRAALPAVAASAFTTRLDSLKPVPVQRIETGLDGAVEDVYVLASLLRRSPEGARTLIPAYLEARELLQPRIRDRTLSTAEVIRLRLADQSASLDIARSGNEAYITRLAAVVDELPTTPQGLAYAALLHRDRAITWLQRNREDQALALVGHAFRQLRYLVDNQMVDRRSAMEVRHQLCLAAAGDYIRLVERDLVRARPRRPDERVPPNTRTSEWVRQTLHYARRTRTLLTELEDAFELPNERHAEGQISATAWRIRTSIIELRAELVAITAVEAGLASLDASRPDGERGEAEPDWPTVAEHYRDLIGRRELTAGDAAEVLTLGMWVALLQAGKLPVAYDLAPALREHRLAVLLDKDPDGMIETVPEYRTVDLRASTEYLKGRRIGIIAEVAPEGPVGELLAARSPGLFETWRTWLPAVPPPAEVGETPLTVYFNRPPWKDRSTD